MDLTTCKLYGIKRKRDIRVLLKINSKKILVKFVIYINHILLIKEKRDLLSQ